MFNIKIRDSNFDVSKTVDIIEREIYTALKPYGFKKHGRTLHRFVSEDISQVINFQVGQAYRNETHLLSVNIGIRVPECELRSFVPEENKKKYYHEYNCNMRSRLGTVEGKNESCYDLRKPIEPIIADILRQIQNTVIPVFEILNDRDAILEKRKDYPNFDTLNKHLILLEEAMIYGHRGELEKAAELFNQYYRLAEKRQKKLYRKLPAQNHLTYLDELAAELGIEIE